MEKNQRKMIWRIWAQLFKKLWAKEENRSRKMDFGQEKEEFEVERSRPRMEEEERR